MMLLYLGLLFPLALLALLGFMEWIEAPIRSEATAERLPEFLDSAPPEEIELYVRDGLKAALERHWLRQRVSRLVRRRRTVRIEQRHPTSAV